MSKSPGKPIPPRRQETDWLTVILITSFVVMAGVIAGLFLSGLSVQ